MGFSYDTWGGSWLTSWGGSWGVSAIPPVDLETHGGIDFHAYRKHLEKIAKIADERLYPKKAAESVLAIADIPVDTPEINKLIQKPEITGTLRLTPKIDYEILSNEIEKVRAYIDIMEENRVKSLRLKEADDEMAFLLMIQ